MGPEAGAASASSPSVHATDTADYLARVARVAPVIRAAADQIEANQRLTPDVLTALHGENLFRLLLPKIYGGEEVDLPTFFQITSAVAENDASTAWCLCQGNGCTTSAAFMEPEIVDKIWGSDPHAVLAWGPGTGKTEAKDDGYILNGRWQFASGSRHATWLGGRVILDAPDGTPAEYALLFPASDAEMTAIWDVIGLRGTSSDAYTVKDLFVPKEHIVARSAYDQERRYEGLLYYIPVHYIFATGFSGVALGIARNMMNLFKELATAKKPNRQTMLLCENPMIQSEVGIGEARIKSARAYMLDETSEVWEDVVAKGEITHESRMRIRLAATYCIHEAKGVIDALYDAAGATTIFNSNTLGRLFRDIHTLTQQAQGRKMYFQTSGAYLMGQDTGTPMR